MVQVNFPTYGTITVSLSTVYDLAAFSPTKITDGLHAIVAGQSSPDDSLGGIFTWDGSSTATEDGVLVVAAPGLATGRWIKTVKSIVGPTGAIGPVGPTGPKGDPDETVRADLQAAINTKAPDVFSSANRVGVAPAYIQRLGEKAGEKISLIELAGKPSGNDYTSWFTNRLTDYPYKEIELQGGPIVLAGAGITGLHNVRLVGCGDTQTTLYCPSLTGDMITFTDSDSNNLERVAIGRAASATSGRGLVLAGSSSGWRVENIYGYGNKDGLIASIGRGPLTGDAQTGNHFVHVKAVDNAGKVLSLKWCHDFGIDGAEIGRVTGSMGYSDVGINLEQSHQGTISGLTKIWDNGVAINILNCQGVSIADEVRVEESRFQNIILDGSSKCAIKCRTHTPNKASGLSGVASAVLLKNGAYDNLLNISQIYSWSASEYLMKCGVEIESGSFDNRVSEGIFRNYTDSAVGGGGATDGTNSISDLIPMAASDSITRAVFALDAPANATRFMSPSGGQTSAGNTGIVFGSAGYITRFDVATSATPGSGETYTYRLLVNGALVGPTISITNGYYSASVGGIKIAIGALDVVQIQETASNNAAVCNHRGFVTFRN